MVTPSAVPVNILTNLNNEVFKLLYLIPYFDGDIKTLPNFITTVDDIISIINQSAPSEITKKLVILTLKNKIKGKAAQCLSITTINEWKELKKHLLENYSDTRSEHTLMYEITHLKQNRETILEYFSRFNDVFLIYKSKVECKYESNSSKVILENALKYFTQCFINNCKDPFRSQLSARNPQKLTEILDLISNDLQYMHNQNSYNQNTQPQKIIPPRHQIQFNKHQSPLHKYPPPQYQQPQYQQPQYQQRPQYSKPFAPSANFRNAPQKTSPMSIQTSQFHKQNQTRTEQLFNQNLENIQETEIPEFEEIEQENENNDENNFLDVDNDQLELNP